MFNIDGFNAFYYYDDLNKAWKFYRETVGLETIYDFGFAKTLKVAHGSHITLIDAAHGRHSTAEPKTVTIALVTEQVEAWYDYLTGVGVSIHRPFNWQEGKAHDGFVALDPEGYFIEVERFNPHSENVELLPLLATIPTTAPVPGSRPENLLIQGTVLWTYYRDLAAAQRFIEELLGVTLLVDQGWAKVYQIAGGGFLGLVDGAHGLHAATDEKSVTLSFFTTELDQWYTHAKEFPGLTMLMPEIAVEVGRVRTFLASEPEGYLLEWNEFLDNAT